MAAKSRTLIARYKGEIVGRNYTNSPITHAAVVFRDDSDVRDDVYRTEPNSDDRDGFRHAVRAAGKTTDDIASQAWQHVSRRTGEIMSLPETKFTAAEIEEANIILAEGFDVYFDRQQKEKIAAYEKERATRYGIQVDHWFNAKQIPKWVKHYAIGGGSGGWRQTKLLEIVPVDSETSLTMAQRFAKLPRATQRKLLNEVCEDMIRAKAWDEIVGLLTVHLGDKLELIVNLAERGSVD